VNSGSRYQLGSVGRRLIPGGPNNRGGLLVSVVLILGGIGLATGIYVRTQANKHSAMTKRYRWPTSEIAFMLRQQIHCTNTRTAMGPNCPGGNPSLVSGRDSSNAGIPTTTPMDRRGKTWNFRLVCESPTVYRLEIEVGPNEWVRRNEKILCR